MEWLIFALSAAVFAALTRIFIKTSRNSKDQTLIFSRYFYGLIPAFIFLFFIGIPPKIEPSFYPSILFASIFDIMGLTFLTISIKKSSFSKSVPFLSFTPVFVILTSFLILGELPSSLGISGILVIVLGAYWLSYGDHKTILDPFKSLYKEAGPKYMFVAALFFSFTGVFFKKSLLASSPIFTVSIVLLISSLFIFFFYLLRGEAKNVLPNRKDFLKLFFLGITSFIVLISVSIGLEKGLVSYIVSIKRFSIILNVIIGAMFFKEKKPVRHIFGAVIMVGGAVLIGLS